VAGRARPRLTSMPAVSGQSGTFRTVHSDSSHEHTYACRGVRERNTRSPLLLSGLLDTLPPTLHYNPASSRGCGCTLSNPTEARFVRTREHWPTTWPVFGNRTETAPVMPYRPHPALDLNCQTAHSWPSPWPRRGTSLRTAHNYRSLEESDAAFSYPLRTPAPWIAGVATSNAR
jgi:hypothetical protein